MNSNRYISWVNKNKLTSSSFEMNKPLLAKANSVSQIQVQNQLQLLLLIRHLITFTIDSSTNSIDSNITDSIIRKVINGKQYSYKNILKSLATRRPTHFKIKNQKHSRTFLDNFATYASIRNRLGFS